MLTKDNKKGMRVQLRNGWFGTMAENCRTNTPMVTVEGYETETGSVYVFDIARVQIRDNYWACVELTDRQQKFREQVKAMGF